MHQLWDLWSYTNVHPNKQSNSNTILIYNCIREVNIKQILSLTFLSIQTARWKCFDKIFNDFCLIASTV